MLALEQQFLSNAAVWARLCDRTPGAELVVVPRRNGAATATAAVEVEVEVAWAAQQPEDLAVHLAVYRQAAPHPVSRLKALRTEDRVAWEYVLGTRASVHVALEEGVSSYVVVLSASEAGIKGEGSFWVRVESSDKAQFDLWDVPLVPRLRAERGSALSLPTKYQSHPARDLEKKERCLHHPYSTSFEFLLYFHKSSLVKKDFLLFINTSLKKKRRTC